MTLLLALANPEFATIVADRRVTKGRGVVETDEANKVTTFVCDDGRFAVAFTGLSRAGNFSTEDWLVDALMEAGKSAQHRIGPTVERLAEMAGSAIGALQVSAEKRRLSIVLLGYHHGDVPPRQYCMLVSNFDAIGGAARPRADDVFTLSYVREERPSPTTTPALVAAFGDEASVAQEHLTDLQRLLSERRSPDAVVNKAISVVRAAAGKSAGLVGKQITSVVLPSDTAEDAIAGYHPEGAAPKSYVPNHVVSTGDFGIAYKGMESRIVDETDSAVPFVPRVGRNERCPCGSGRKFKRCHGAGPTPLEMVWRIGPSVVDDAHQ